MTLPVLVGEIEVQNELGEGIIWDARREVVWWTDILRSRIFRYDPASSQLESWSTPNRLTCFAPVADENLLVAAFDYGFAFFDPVAATVKPLVDIEPDSPDTRLNDGRTDRQGRFWAGSMVEGDNTDASGALYCLDRQRRCTKTISGLRISNGLCWSPDSSLMYHTDTPSGRIDQYAFDAASGEIGERRHFATMEAGCSPDGATVDAEGYLWSAQWGGGNVVRFAPDGVPDLVLPIPASQPTCVAFGGRDLDLLFVSSARADLSPGALQRQSSAGNVFVYQTPFRGLAEAEYRGA
jgi:sugar lactone lactonase YvrE